MVEGEMEEAHYQPLSNSGSSSASSSSLSSLVRPPRSTKRRSASVTTTSSTSSTGAAGGGAGSSHLSPLSNETHLSLEDEDVTVTPTASSSGWNVPRSDRVDLSDVAAAWGSPPRLPKRTPSSQSLNSSHNADALRSQHSSSASHFSTHPPERSGSPLNRALPVPPPGSIPSHLHSRRSNSASPQRQNHHLTTTHPSSTSRSVSPLRSSTPREHRPPVSRPLSTYSLHEPPVLLRQSSGSGGSMSRSSSIKSGLASSADGSPARDWGDGGDADFTDEEDDDVPDWMGVDEERTDDHTPRRQRLMSEAFVIPVQSVNEPEPEPVIEKTSEVEVAPQPRHAAPRDVPPRDDTSSPAKSLRSLKRMQSKSSLGEETESGSRWKSSSLGRDDEAEESTEVSVEKKTERGQEGIQERASIAGDYSSLLASPANGPLVTSPSGGVGLALDWDPTLADELLPQRRTSSPVRSSYVPPRPSSRTPPMSPSPETSSFPPSPSPSPSPSHSTPAFSPLGTPFGDSTPSFSSPLTSAPIYPSSPQLGPSTPSPIASPTFSTTSATSADPGPTKITGPPRSSSRTSSRGALERDGPNSPSYMSTSFAARTGNGGLAVSHAGWHTTVTSPNPRSPNSSDFLSLPTTPEQPQHSEETAHEAPLPSTSRAPHSPGRKHKEPKELPPVRQKSTRRPVSIVSTNSDVPPSLPTEEGQAQAGLGVPTGVEEGGLYPDGGRSMLRPRETNPLSASDFSDFYGTFEHAPSAYDSEPPAQHHPSAIPTLPDVVELASPPLPPIPSPGADSEVSSLKTTVAVDRRRQIAAGEDDPTYSASFSDMSNDLFHDADSTRAESTRGGGGELAVEEAPEPPSGTGTPRGDAKARAAAFVADLKRAKLQAAAAAAAAAASTQPEPVQASPTIPSPIVYPSSPALPQVPQEPAVPPRNTSPLPPTPSHEPTRTISPLPPPPSHGVASPEQLSPSESPDVEVLANVKTPASNETYTVPTPRPSLSPSLSGLSTQTASTQSFAPSHSNSVMDLDKLTGARYRPLPDCLRTTDVRKARTPAERAKLYAVKINALARENSGTEAWIGFVKASHTPPGTNGPFPGAPGFASPNTSPGRSRHSRDDGSSASFPARNDGTGYRAREISYGSFVPKDLTPNTPFPGVLHLGRGGKPTPLAKSSFFSLGRKASSSKRLPPSASSMRSPGLSPLSFNGNVSSGRAMGPRMPGAPRASFDSGSSGPFSPPLGGSALPQQPQRASFSYHGPTSTPPIAEVDPQMLQKLIDVLPHGDRQTLASCLARSGNDEVSAISLFLSEEAERRQ